MSRQRRNTITRYPDEPAPVLHCPTCDRRLNYLDTVFSGVRPPERYDRFICGSHGAFEYRHRTRKLRAIAGV